MANSSHLIPLFPGNTYHVFNRANGQDNLFRCDENYRFFMEKYTAYIYPIAETYAYCLMPNHFHLMIKIREKNELEKLGVTDLENLEVYISKQFSNFFNSYTKSYNKRYCRNGSLFNPRFKRKLISNTRYFTQLIAYIHYNPVHHGFVKDIHDWHFSSFHAYLLDKRTRLNIDEALHWFGSRDSFIQFHQNLNIKDLALDFDF